MTAMRAAIRRPNTNRVVGTDALARVCRAANGLGFYAVSADDHIVFDGSYISCGSADAVGPGEDHDKLEIMTALAFAAAWTEYHRRARRRDGVIAGEVLPAVDAGPEPGDAPFSARSPGRRA